MTNYDEEIRSLSDLLLEIGTLLMCSGASTSKIRITVQRVADSYGYNANLSLTHKALMLSIHNKNRDYFLSDIKQAPAHVPNFKIVSGISRLSWKIVEEKPSIYIVEEELERLKNISHYPRIAILLLVSFAGASFCRLFGGGYQEMIVAFVATFVGLFIRQEAARKKFNPNLCVFFAALASSLISGLSIKYNIGIYPEYAFATSVLYLIPGIPLINSLSDLLEGNIINGLIRGVSGLISTAAIALGLLGAILIYNIQ